MKKINKYLLISIAVILFICAIVTVCHFAWEDNNPSDHENKTEDFSQPELNENEENGEKCTVAFFDSAGHLLKEDQVEKYKGTEPPENFVPDADKIFMGWDKDFSFIFSNINIRPNYLDISNDKNYVYANAMYAKPDSSISVKVKIGGMVNLAALQMYIEYDETALEYVDAVNLDEGIMINKEENNSRIRMAFLSDENVTGSVDFVELVFRVKGTSGDKAIIMYDIDKAAMISNDNEIVPADYTVKDTVIHIY